VAAGLESGRAVPPPSLEERRQAVLEHYDYLLSAYGVRVGVRHARKHLAAYADDSAEAGWALPPQERQRLVTCDEPRAVAGLLARLYGACAHEEAA
jgi:tRNA-dihydrouridine synthase